MSQKEDFDKPFLDGRKTVTVQIPKLTIAKGELFGDSSMACNMIKEPNIMTETSAEKPEDTEYNSYSEKLM